MYRFLAWMDSLIERFNQRWADAIRKRKSNASHKKSN